MGRHVFLGVTSSCAEVVTLCANEISFSCMGYHVFFEGTSLCAGAVTLHAIKRLLWTSIHVSFQMISFDGWVAALLAAVGLLSIMLKHVFFRSEGNIALNTFSYPWVKFVFSLHCHCLFSLFCFTNHAIQLWGNWRKCCNRNYIQRGLILEKWK